MVLVSDYAWDSGEEGRSGFAAAVDHEGADTGVDSAEREIGEGMLPKVESCIIAAGWRGEEGTLLMGGFSAFVVVGDLFGLGCGHRDFSLARREKMNHQDHQEHQEYQEGEVRWRVKTDAPGEMGELDKIGREIVDSAFKVHKAKAGPGLLESIYEKLACFMRLTKKQGLKVRRQVHLPIRYDDLLLETGLRLDLLVEEKVIVEIKAVEKVIQLHTAQIISHFEACGFAPRFPD